MCVLFAGLQVFKLYVFSRSVHSFVETLEAHFEGGGGGGDGDGDDGTEKLIREKFVGGFNKLSEGFLLFQQVRGGCEKSPFALHVVRLLTTRSRGRGGEGVCGDGRSQSQFFVESCSGVSEVYNGITFFNFCMSRTCFFTAFIFFFLLFLLIFVFVSHVTQALRRMRCLEYGTAVGRQCMGENHLPGWWGTVSFYFSFRRPSHGSW